MGDACTIVSNNKHFYLIGGYGNGNIHGHVSKWEKTNAQWIGLSNLQNIQFDRPSCFMTINEIIYLFNYTGYLASTIQKLNCK